MTYIVEQSQEFGQWPSSHFHPFSVRFKFGHCSPTCFRSSISDSKCLPSILDMPPSGISSCLTLKTFKLLSGNNTAWSMETTGPASVKITGPESRETISSLFFNQIVLIGGSPTRSGSELSIHLT